MNINQNHASKDYLREYHSLLDDASYAISRIDKDCTARGHFLLTMIYCQRLSEGMCDSLLRYSASGPTRDLALRMHREHSALALDMKRALGRTSGGRRSAEWEEEYKTRAERIFVRMLEDMRCADVRERINCDFIREMIPLREGCIRASQNLLSFDAPRETAGLAADIISLAKRDISDLQRLHCMIDC